MKVYLYSQTEEVVLASIQTAAHVLLIAIIDSAEISKLPVTSFFNFSKALASAESVVDIVLEPAVSDELDVDGVDDDVGAVVGSPANEVFVASVDE